MKKIYVLDTNVLLHDPYSVNKFEDNILIIPGVVLEELDKFKKGNNEINRNARLVNKHFDELRSCGKKLHEGIPLENGGLLKVILDNHKIAEYYPTSFSLNINDNKILGLLRYLIEHQEEILHIKNAMVKLVTKDINLRVKADALGLEAEDYTTDKVNIETLYSGIKEIYIDGETISKYYEKGEIEVSKLNLYEKDYIYPNSGIVFVNSNNPSRTALGVYSKKEGKIKKLLHENEMFYNVKAKNLQQKIAIEHLLNRNIPLVTLVGKAGTGKTLIALASALRQVQQDGFFYKRVVVMRPIVAMGNDIGFLPGDIEKKLNPWMQPIFDNLEFLFDGDLNKIDDMKSSNLLDIEAITYIRGRSLPSQFIIVDEAQNLTPHEVKTIITRAGENTKIVLTGDPYQIDHPYLDSSSNGLTYCVEKFKDHEMAAHLTFVKGERSTLAEIASEIL